MLIQCNFNMDTQTTQTQTTQTQTMQTTKPTQYIDWRDDEDDFDLIEFGIASNGGRLSMKGA